MKQMILYDSKYGFTKKVAEFIHANLSDSEIHKITDFNQNLSTVSEIFIGTYIYKGEMSKETSKFLKKYKVSLLKQKLKIFCSALDKTDFNNALQNSIDPEIFYHATIINCGGEVVLSSLKKSEKKELKNRLNVQNDVYVFNEKEVLQLIKK